MNEEKYITKKGKEGIRYILATLNKEALDLIRIGGFLSYVDKNSGNVYAVRMNQRKPLTPEEKAQKEKEKAEKKAKNKEKREIKRRENLERKLKEKIRKAIEKEANAAARKAKLEKELQNLL